MSSEDEFYKYYAAQSTSQATLDRFTSVKSAMERVAEHMHLGSRPWRVADIGCGAGTQCMIWARDGHAVAGIDINEQLVELGRKRAEELGLEVDFQLGSATQLPWADRSKDICLCPELLEHVAEWEGVLSEITRVTAPGGLVFISTTNRLCPRQEEFNLPGYSWYPAALKRHYERLSVTTRPEIANHAKYPAVHWFTFAELRSYFAKRGYRCIDRFDVASLTPRGPVASMVLQGIRSTAITRWLGQLVTSYTLIVAKSPES